MRGFNCCDITPYVTPTRTGALLCHSSSGSFSLDGKTHVEFSPAEMIEYLNYIQRYSGVSPRTYWCEFPYYTIINGSKQHFQLGYRPEDLENIETIEQKTWKKHVVHLNRLESFPLDKAEYYLRLKESHGVSSVRSLSKITGEDWSYIAKVLRTLDLSDPVKEYLRENKENHAVIRFFNLKRLLDIVKQGEERFQLSRFRQLMEESARSQIR